MRKGKPVAAGIAEPDDDLWEELRDEWEAFIVAPEREEGRRAAGEQLDRYSCNASGRAYRWPAPLA